jgi:hypothetical protein
MSDPTGYSVPYSFSGFQASNPTTPLPAPALDNEFAKLAAAVLSIIAAVKDVRRSDGVLNDGIVTFDSLAPGLKLTFDPTNGNLVAAAVAIAQAAATSAAGSSTSASGSATAAAGSASAAAASAATVNLSLYLSKAGNLAGLGNNDTALANIGAAKADGSTLTGRLAPHTGYTVTDWNLVTTSGWYASDVSSANTPYNTAPWLVQVVSWSALYSMQIAYPFTAATTGTSFVTPYRRFSYDNGAGVIVWTPWESAGTVPVGTTIWTNANVAPPGFLKENGALISRATYPSLWAFANASGNLVTEAFWASGYSGAFSNGDLSTTFRLPDTRGEFIRGYDDSRGVDSGRVLGAHQADMLKDHTHPYTAPALSSGTGSTPNYFYAGTGAATTGGASIGGAETRPRNNAKLACIKF